MVNRFLWILSCWVVLFVDGYYVRPRTSVLPFPLKSTTWQEDLDKILDVDTTCESRRAMVPKFLKRLEEVSKDFRAAVQERNIERIAPRRSQYGKAIQGLRRFNNQLLTDVIPDLFIKTVPKIVDEGPKILNQLAESTPRNLFEQGQKMVENLKEISQDPSALQAAVDEVRNELKNVVKSTPIGLESPYYEVLKSTDQFEIRRYPRYSVAMTSYTSQETSSSDTVSTTAASLDRIPVEFLASSRAFQRLAGYIFGENSRAGQSEKMKMTVPVIMDGESMSFVLPNDYDSSTAPVPESKQVEFQDIVNEVVAVREFTGLVTEGEINRQKSKLEAILFAEGIEYDAQSFKVLQYNPPYTLPWVRRNELLVKVTYPTSREDQQSMQTTSDTPLAAIAEEDEEKEDRSMTEDTAKFYSAPEAGD